MLASLADDEAVAEVFEALDDMEEILSKQRWLAGDGKRFTEADLRAFVTIVQFDAVYVVSHRWGVLLLGDEEADALPRLAVAVASIS